MRYDAAVVLAMASRKRDFEKEEAKLRVKYKGPKEGLAAYELAELEQDWARALIKAKPSSKADVVTAMREAAERGIEPSLVLEAAEHMAKADQWRAKAASGAGSGAEGLIEWHEVLDVRLARAWLLSAAAKVPAIRKQGSELRKALWRDEYLSPEQRRDLRVLKRILG
jgi:hypothetical protein